jgi:ribonucleoside-diphosphate reductase alpha chain
MIDHAVAAWRRRVGDPASVPPTFAAVTDIGVSDQLTMLAALQPFVDNAISKTVVVPATLAFEAFQPTFDIAYDLGLKGCSAYRATPARPGVFCPREPSPATPVIASEPAGTPPGT